jgi:hypothetical protein
MREIERQASEAWGATPCEVPVELGAAAMAMATDEHACKAVAAYDYLTVQIPSQLDTNHQGGETQSQVARRQPSGSSAPKRRRGPHSGGPR